MNRLLMLDSGAFSVWTRGHSVDLENYISYCVAHPDASYYVSLDVIPGTYADKKSLRSKAAREDSCLRGWRNYRRMIQELPKDRVIPVYHQNDDIYWLRKYLAFGTPYIGISPANDNGTNQKIKWLSGLRKILFDGAGRSVVKTHGFAVTSFDMMKYWEWYSVDSATWQRAASYGELFLPRKTGGSFDYFKAPIRIGITARCGLLQKRQMHYGNMTPLVKEKLLEYLSVCGQDLGAYKIENVPCGYKLRKGKEVWDLKGKSVQKLLAEGVTTSRDARALANAYFIKQANKVLPVEHIYLAGFLHERHVEFKFRTRLLSHAFIGESKKLAEYFRWLDHWKRKALCE